MSSLAVAYSYNALESTALKSPGNRRISQDMGCPLRGRLDSFWSKRMEETRKNNADICAWVVACSCPWFLGWNLCWALDMELFFAARNTTAWTQFRQITVPPLKHQSWQCIAVSLLQHLSAELNMLYTRFTPKQRQYTYIRNCWPESFSRCIRVVSYSNLFQNFECKHVRAHSMQKDHTVQSSLDFPACGGP